LKALAANEAFAEKELDVLLEHLKEMRPAAFGGAEGGGGGGGGGGGKSGGNSKRGNLTKPRDPPELMTLGQCNGIVAMVWQRKVREDILADQKKKPHVKFSKFVHDHLLRQYGTKSMADKKLRDLTHSVRTFELNETGNPLQPRFKMVAEMAGLLGYDEWSDEKTSFCLAFLALCLSMDQQGDPIAYVRRVTAAANEEANAGASAQPGKGKKTSLQNLFKASKSTDASSKAAAMEAKLNMLMPPNMKDLLIKAELNVTTQAVEATVTVFVTQEAARQRVIDELEELTFGGEREMNFVAGGKQEVQLVNLDEVMASVVMPAWQDAEQRKQLEWQAVLAGMFEEADDNGNGLMEFCELRDLNEKEGSRIGLDVITTVFDEAVRNSSLETGVEMDSITLRAFVKMCMDHSLFQIESGSQRTFLDPKDITFGADLGAGGMGANGAVAGAANAFKSRAKRRSVPIPTLQELTKDKAERMVQVEKDEAISSVLKSALQQNFLFRHLDDKLLDEVVGYMTELTAKAGDTIIKEGSKGDYLYLAEKGTFDVLVQGSKVHEYVCKEAESERPIFGELALMYAKPRAASVMATADSRLWKLGRGGFRLVQAHASGMLDPVQVLRKVEIFASLRFDQLQTLRDTMKELHYEAGQMVFKEGDDGDGMYIVGTGQVAVIKRELANGQYVDKEAFTLGESAYFGERALLEHKPRAAGIKAVVPTKCMFISRGEFERVLGPLQALLDEDRRKREGAANQRQKQLQAKGLAKATRSSFRLEVPVFQHPCGVAYLATHSESGECYTLRQETKEHIIRLRDEQRVQREVEVLRSLDELDLTCTVLPTLLRTFQTPDSVYMLLRQRTACDLAQLVEDVGPLDGPPLRFVAACVASALEVLHSPALHSVYRHLMPEALALLDNGYVCLMDLKHCENEWRGCQTLCGSPLYFAPEMVRGEQQTSAVDMWAMGVLLYELASGESPWGSDANECDDVTLLKRIAEHTDDGLRTPSRVRALRREGEDGSPDGGSSPEDTEALLELLTPLLQPAIEERHTAAAIKAHPFLAQVEWAKLKEAEAPSPLMDAASSLLTRKVQTMDWEELEAAPWEPDMGETLRLNGLDPFADF
jgi:CRP-like cAMP-binding protein